MKAIYDAHFEGMNGASIDGARAAVGDRSLGEPDETSTGYVRTTQRELGAHFPRLPNPTLVMYVYPHLAGPARVPVPGYATTFPLYESVEYALPGEIPIPSRPSSMTPEVSP
jgi:conjugative transfer region lipoprotein (TIGR03751 family)